jgi:isocitrate dehydrogenase kinase/phosphatase
VEGQRRSASLLANEGAAAVEQAFDTYLHGFGAITARAASRFAHRDWQGILDDASLRLDLYDASVAGALDRLHGILGTRRGDRLVWAGMKAVYSGHIAGRANWQLAETFFNSATRRVFSTVGVDPDIEFVDTDRSGPPDDAAEMVHRTVAGGDHLDVAHRLVGSLGPAAPFADLERDARATGARLAAAAPGRIDSIEVVDALFYRRSGAYLIGRMHTDDRWVPLAIAFRNTANGVVVDAVLTEEDDISILFSFTRSHFHVDVQPAHSLIEFLRPLMPRKRIAELYMAIGHHKHGKTVLYRDLVHHLSATEDRFDIAPGTPGMVMVVFTMPGFDVVFKVIRDHLPPHKRITRDTVRDRYRLVFRHDRAGRLVEAQEFEHLRLHRDRFTDTLAAELLTEASRTVREEGDHLVFDHAYIERRVVPLDVYVREAGAEDRRAAITDYGRAIEELAVTGVFPGDLLPKNFGVTRHGRVVSYDYDELELLSRIRFRAMPVARTPEDEMANEAWYGVRHEDVFPEELGRFMGDEYRSTLADDHAGLFDPSWWRGIQERLAAGELIDVSPYPEDRRLGRPADDPPDSPTPVGAGSRGGNTR